MLVNTASCAPQVVNSAQQQLAHDLKSWSLPPLTAVPVHKPPSPTRSPSAQQLSRASEVVASCSDSDFLLQVVTENSRLATKVNHLERECAKAEGRAQAKSEFIDELNGRIESANARHAQALGTLQARVAELSAARAPADRPGRGRANTKVLPEAKFEPLTYGDIPFFADSGIHDKCAMVDKLGAYDVARLKAYWPDDKSKVRAQSKQRAEFFLDLLALDTGKWPVGDVHAMFSYLLGTDDLGPLPGQFSNRVHQIAHWLWRSRVPSYSALTANTPAAKYMYRRARHYMTGVKAVHALYQIWKGVLAYPTGFREGVDPIPERRVAQKRKHDADADATGSSGLSD